MCIRDRYGNVDADFCLFAMDCLFCFDMTTDHNLVLVAQTVTQASWGVMQEDRMDVEPCYPLFSAELESAKALASSQMKF